MKNAKIQKLKKLDYEFTEAFRIESKMLKTNNLLTEEEISFLKARAEEGAPVAEFQYGLYFFLQENDEKTANEWWNKFFYHSNGFGLWRASGIFAYLGDEFYDWSMKCLRRSAWRQFKLSKMMLKEMKEHPFRFPEA